jgi:hypothetical protein
MQSRGVARGGVYAHIGEDEVDEARIAGTFARSGVGERGRWECRVHGGTGGVCGYAVGLRL